MSRLQEAFEILAKYGSWDIVAAEHDEIFISCNYDEISDDDMVRIQNLGLTESEYEEGTLHCWV